MRFTFEIVRSEEPSRLTSSLNLADFGAAWCHVAFLASRHQSDANEYILAKDDDGGVIIRTGVKTALASIPACRRNACPLKSHGCDRGTEC